MPRSQREKQDPTKQARNREKAERVMASRLETAEREVKALFNLIRFSSRNVQPIVNQLVYDYEFTDDDAQQLDRSLRFIINDSVVETQGDEVPFDWYFTSLVEVPYRAGTVEENRDFNQLIEQAIIAGALVNGLPPVPVQIENILFSDRYRQGLGKTVEQNFVEIKGLSNETSRAVSRIITTGISSGRSPTEIAQDITERFAVAQSSANRIVNTQLNWAYNDARMNTSKLMAEQTGLRAGVVHLSALLPTTRDHHAARHGNAYTVEEQNAWWNSDANRINCYCSVRTVLIDSQGKVIQENLIDELNDEKGFFDRAK